MDRDRVPFLFSSAAARALVTVTGPRSMQRFTLHLRGEEVDFSGGGVFLPGSNCFKLVLGDKGKERCDLLRKIHSRTCKLAIHHTLGMCFATKVNKGVVFFANLTQRLLPRVVTTHHYLL